MRYPQRSSVVVLAVLIVSCCRYASAVNYYVNDISTAGDVWCTAIGSVTNSGTSSNAPALHIQDILDDYVVAPGDTIYVDTGLYQLSANITVTSADSGSSTGGVVTIKGAGAGTVLDRGNQSGNAYGIHLNGAEYVVIEDLCCTNAAQGLRIEGGSHNQARNCEFARCKIGVVLSSGSDHTIDGCDIHHNQEQGILGSSSASPILTGNDIHDNQNVSNADDRGIDLFSCNSAQISGNAVYSNGYYGIRLSSSSSPVISGLILPGTRMRITESRNIRCCRLHFR